MAACGGGRNVPAYQPWVRWLFTTDTVNTSATAQGVTVALFLLLQLLQRQTRRSVAQVREHCVLKRHSTRKRWRILRLRHCA